MVVFFLKQANVCRLVLEECMLNFIKKSCMSLCVYAKSFTSLYTISFKWKKSQNSATKVAKL